MHLLRRHIPLAVWLCLVAGLAAAAAVDGRGWRRNLRLHREVQELESKNAEMSRENQRLAREAHALKTNPVAMERAVREELGFIRAGEMVLQLRQSDAP